MVITCNRFLAKDAQNFFNMATGYSFPKKWNYLSIAPNSLRSDLIDLINKEIFYKRNGKNGEIWLKCNALIDQQIIKALYNASKNDVRIQLIIRGVCCLRPQVKGLSENIFVKA